MAHFVTSICPLQGTVLGFVSRYFRLNMWRVCLALDSEGNESRKCSTDLLCQSRAHQHSGRLQRPSVPWDLVGSQGFHSTSSTNWHG